MLLSGLFLLGVLRECSSFPQRSSPRFKVMARRASTSDVLVAANKILLKENAVEEMYQLLISTIVERNQEMIKLLEKSTEEKMTLLKEKSDALLEKNEEKSAIREKKSSLFFLQEKSAALLEEKSALLEKKSAIILDLTKQTMELGMILEDLFKRESGMTTLAILGSY